MNYIGAIVKILETPKQKVINSNTLCIRFRVQLPQIRKIQVVNLIVWGNLAYEVFNYYKINDYILIEGYISYQDNLIFEKKNKSLKKVRITAIKVYPFLLNSNRSIKKL